MRYNIRKSQEGYKYMRVAVIGSGGREHAIYWKLSQSIPEKDVFVLPGNAGIPNSIKIDISDFASIMEFCEEKDIDLVVVGPEVPLTNGIVDYFSESDIRIFGPTREASILESSKIWSKRFMSKYNVSTADFEVFDNFESATKYIEGTDGNLVIKYDGLAAGKGVFVCSSIEESKSTLNTIANKFGGQARFIIEKRLSGFEISIIGFTDGTDIQLLLPSQDHKQAYDGDKGPNTGGMGAYCPVPFCNEDTMRDIRKNIIEPTIMGLQKENIDYRGVIYFGLMLTKEGPMLLEYNVRLGDPETEVLLPSMKSSLHDLILACFDGTLNNYKMEFHKGTFIDVVLTSGGYPASYKKGCEITGLESLSNDVLVFHAGTKEHSGKLLTSGGRVLNIIAKGDSLDDAIEKVYKEVPKVHFTDIHYRKDIGKRSYHL